MNVSNPLAAGVQDTRSPQRATPMQETMAMTILYAVSAQLSGRPSRLGILRIHLAMRG